MSESSPVDLPPPSSGGALSIGQLVRGIRHRWKLFAATTMLVAALVIGAASLLKPVWNATAVIQVEPNRRIATDFAAAAAGQTPDQALIDTEVGLMRSREVIEAAVRSLRLQSDPEFIGKLDPKLAATEKERVRSATNGVLDRLSAERQQATYLVNVNVRSRDPVKAAAIANAVAEQYLRFSVQGRATSATQTSDALRSQLGQLAQDVRDADARVAQYRGSKGIVQSSNAGTITEQQVAPLSNQLTQAEAEAAAAASKLATARNQVAGGGLDSVSGVLNSPVIAELRRQRAEVLRQQGEARTRYGARHPTTVNLDQQLAVYDRQLREEAQRTVNGLEGEAQATAASAASLRRDLANLRTRQAQETREGVTAESLERDAEAKRTAYNQLAQAAQQSNQQREGVMAVGRMAEAATPPNSPSFPNRPLFLVIGVFLGLLSGTALVLLLTIMDSSIRSASDIEGQLGVAYLGSVPRISTRRLRKLQQGGAPWDDVVERPMSTYIESLRHLRSLLFTEEHATGRVVAICSSVPGEGKTSVASSLGRVLAMSGDRVLLVDCDLRRHMLSGMVTPSGAGGLVEVLAGTASLDTAVVKDERTDLHLLPIVGDGFVVRDLLGGTEMAELLAELRKRYDLVLLDTPPILAVADARAIAHRADVSILLIGYNRTSRFAVRAALKRLRQSGATVLGAVLSGVDRRGLGQSDEAYYDGAYKKYYAN